MTWSHFFLEIFNLQGWQLSPAQIFPHKKGIVAKAIEGDEAITFLFGEFDHGSQGSAEIAGILLTKLGESFQITLVRNGNAVWALPELVDLQN